MNIAVPGSYLRELIINFLGLRILEIFYADPGSLRPWIQEEKIRI